jgi:hypothetical protein
MYGYGTGDAGVLIKYEALYTLIILQNTHLKADVKHCYYFHTKTYRKTCDFT